MNHSTPGLPVHHQLPEFTQMHVHRVNDAIQPCHPLSSPSPPAPNPSEHQGLSFYYSLIQVCYLMGQAGCLSSRYHISILASQSGRYITEYTSLYEYFLEAEAELPIGQSLLISCCKGTRKVVFIPEYVFPAKIRRWCIMVESRNACRTAPQCHIRNKCQMMGANTNELLRIRRSLLSSWTA